MGQCEERVYRGMAENLTLYFIFGNMEFYDDFEKLVNQSCIYHVENLDKIEVKDNNPVNYIYNQFRQVRGRYEKEKETVYRAVKYCYKVMVV